MPKRVRLKGIVYPALRADSVSLTAIEISMLDQLSA
jgi:hypothetical protein